MLNRIKQTIKHSIIYGFGNISTKIVGFILLPIYASHIPIDEYGKLAILEAFGQLLIAVFSLRIPTAIMRWLAENKNENERKSIVFSGICLVLLSISFLFIGMYTTKSAIADHLLGTPYLTNYIFILSITISFSIFNQISFQLFRFFEKPVQYVLITVTRLLIVLSMSILLILHYNYGILGVLISQMIGSIFVFCLSIPMVIKNSNFKISVKFTVEMFQYSWPLIFSTLSVMVLSIGDKFILKKYCGFDEVGVYSLGYKIASVINMFVIQPFETGYLPIAFKMCNSEDGPRFFSKILTYFSIALLLTIMIISFFSKELIILLTNNPAYISAYSIIPVISFLFLTKGFQYVFSIGIHCAKKTKYNFFIVTIGTIINLTLNVIFIPIWGRFAAAFTSIFSGIIIAVLYYIYAQKYYPVQYEISKIIKMIIISIGLLFLALYPIQIPLYLNILKKCVLLAIFPIILFLFNFFEPIEILRLKQSWNKWKNPGSWIKNISRDRQ